MERVMGWICSLPHPIKIVIGGNHDVCTLSTPSHSAR
jgi:hypothetical protein